MNENGRSMIEMLGVLAIIGVLSVGGIAGYSKAMSKYRTNKTIEQITQISNGIRTLYSSQRNYSGVAANVLRKAKILPESAFESSTSGHVTNPFGGDLYVGPRGKYQNGDNKAFYIEITSVPDDACVELLSQEWGDATSLISYGIGGGGSANNFVNNCNAGDNATWRCGTQGVMTMTQIMNACAGNDNQITWNFF